VGLASPPEWPVLCCFDPMFTANTLHLSKGSSANDIVRYLTDGLAIGDYYNEKGENFGQWHGKIIETLGIPPGLSLGKNNEAFVNLLQGRHPISGELIKAQKAISIRSCISLCAFASSMWTGVIIGTYIRFCIADNIR